jgi:hypothetical protein
MNAAAKVVDTTHRMGASGALYTDGDDYASLSRAPSSAITPPARAAAPYLS